MPRFTKWEKLVLQDLLLLFIGVACLLVSTTGVFGETGFLTVLVGCGFMGFALYDFLKLTNQEPVLK